jgi:hypothetical protein
MLTFYYYFHQNIEALYRPKHWSSIYCLQKNVCCNLNVIFDMKLMEVISRLYHFIFEVSTF